jgi:hypothetical protein
VVPPPHAHSCGAVEAQVFPGPPEGFYTGDSPGVEVPFHAPLGTPVIDVPDVGLLPHCKTSGKSDSLPHLKPPHRWGRCGGPIGRDALVPSAVDGPEGHCLLSQGKKFQF